jgi:hypothetical protein
MIMDNVTFVERRNVSRFAYLYEVGESARQFEIVFLNGQYLTTEFPDGLPESEREKFAMYGAVAQYIENARRTIEREGEPQIVERIVTVREEPAEPSAERTYRGKLSEVDVCILRQRAREDESPPKLSSLADDFGMSAQGVSNAIRGISFVDAPIAPLSDFEWKRYLMRAKKENGPYGPNVDATRLRMADFRKAVSRSEIESEEYDQ